VRLAARASVFAGAGYLFISHKNEARAAPTIFCKGVSECANPSVSPTVLRYSYWPHAIGQCNMTPTDHLRLTREELHNLVWAKPMTQVSRDFQISDRAKDIPKPPLPEFVAKPPKEKKVKAAPVEQTAKKPKLRSMFDERKQTLRKVLKEFRNALSEAIDYSVRIESWNCDYSFGLNSSYDPLRRDDDVSFLFESPYNEYRDLVLKGAFLEPAQLKEQKFEAHFTRRSHLNEKSIDEHLHRYEEAPPKSVGGFSKQGHCIAAFLAVPEDAFALIFQNAQANKIKFMTLRGQKLRYGRGQIHRYYLQEQQDEEPA